MLFPMLRRLRSNRVIEYEIKHSVDFIWLVSGRTIDHVTISNLRRKHTKQLKDLSRLRWYGDLTNSRCRLPNRASGR